MIPSPHSSPARWASIMSGRTPAPTTTRSQSKLLPLPLITALDLRRLRRGVDRHHVLAGQQLDRVLLVPGDLVDVGLGPLSVAAQVLLGERRAFVGRFGLPPDQQDRALGALLAQLRGAA